MEVAQENCGFAAGYDKNDSYQEHETEHVVELMGPEKHQMNDDMNIIQQSAIQHYRTLFLITGPFFKLKKAFDQQDKTPRKDGKISLTTIPTFINFPSNLVQANIL